MLTSRCNCFKRLQLFLYILHYYSTLNYRSRTHMIQCSSGTFCDLHITSTFGHKASSVARYIFVHNFVPKIVTYFGLKIVQFWTLFCQTENRDIFWHIFRYKNVPKYNPLLPRIFGWIFSGFIYILFLSKFVPFLG